MNDRHGVGRRGQTVWPNEAHRDDDFIPATTVAEAVGRIYGLTGARPQGRGEKRALVALRDALSLDVDIVRTNAVLGAALAEELAVEWLPSLFTDKNHVTLAGLNALLHGAARAYQRGSLRRLRHDTAASLSGPEWTDFQPAISKIEAVTRIATLTGAPPESLGPGSKERKSVLENLADRLLPDRNLDRSSKTRLGRSLALELDVAWPDTAYSTGETISLEGLNLILAGAERRLGRLGASTSDLLLRPEDEGAALVSALRDGFGDGTWDGRASIMWMLKNGVRGAFDNEWQGFYFEARGREVLSRSFAPSRQPPRSSFGNTTFDYALNFVWDLKVHTASQHFPSTGQTRAQTREALLNDVEAMRRCVSEGGLGFLLLSGAAAMDDDGSFVEWHRTLKAAHGLRVQPSNSGRSRTRKSAFRPLRLEALWLPDLRALDAAIAGGALKPFRQGRQAPDELGGRGAARRPKYMLRTGHAAGLEVAHTYWPAGDLVASHPNGVVVESGPMGLW